MNCWIFTTMILVLTISTNTQGAKILLLPVPQGSHVMNFHQMGEALLEAGHKVHVMTDSRCGSTAKLVKSGIVVHSYDTPGGCLMEDPEFEAIRNEILFQGATIGGVISLLDVVNNITYTFSETIFKNDTLFEELKAEKFDLCVVDGLIYFRTMNLVPYKLDLPVVTFLATFNPLDASIPALPSFTPTIEGSHYSDEMTFMERLINSFKMFAADKLTIWYMYRLSDSIVPVYAPEKPYRTLSEMASDSLLWLVQNEIALDYPQVRLPHVVDIGGTNVSPGRPLKEKFQKIMDGAPHGVIIVSFGSMLVTYPRKLSVPLLAAFRQLKQHVIWRSDGKDFDEVPQNVHLVQWLPQNDLLAHAKTKAFVTHCGANGQFEALYHAVPMLGLPLFADQFYAAKRMAKKGLGIEMDIFNYDPEVLKDNINQLVYNDTYKNTMIKHSQIFKDRPMTPKQTMVFWIEHVIKYGAKHLRSVCISMPWYKYWCIDIACTSIGLCLLLIFITYKIICCMIRGVKNCVTQKGKSLKADKLKKNK